ncbi:hypothetical protein [Helicobacter acinonychis]|uniref:hypothetical protein n=1 Tax=Helicobacter acinonychis TaxID=212 RepID=UPI00349FD085
MELLEQIDHTLNQKKKIRKTIGVITPYSVQKNACNQRCKNATSRILTNPK